MTGTKNCILKVNHFLLATNRQKFDHWCSTTAAGVHESPSLPTGAITLDSSPLAHYHTPASTFFWSTAACILLCLVARLLDGPFCHTVAVLPVGVS
jgi:hypothetical protein